MTDVTELVNTLGPDVIYAVLISGVWLATTAVYVPGTGFPEVASLLTLLVAGVGLLMLPTNVIGLLLLIAALTCFLLLIYFRQMWLLVVAGAVLQIVGSVFLFRVGSRPIVWTIVLMNTVSLAYHQIILMPGLRVQGAEKRMDISTLIGADGEVIATLDPVGTIHIQGELWSARADQVIEKGQLVRVVGRKGLRLQVVPSDGEHSRPNFSEGEKNNQM